MIRIDMEMPKTCEDCQFLDFYLGTDRLICKVTDDDAEDDEDFDHTQERPDWCPLLPVEV